MTRDVLPSSALIFWFGSHQMVDHGLATRDFFISLVRIIAFHYASE